MIEGFDHHYRLFRADERRRRSTVRGRRLDGAAAGGAASASASTTSGSRECVDGCTTELDAGSLDDDTWRRAKLLYIGLLVDHKRPELAETFFNSVVTRVLRRTYVHNDFAFVRAAISTEYIESDPPIYRSYYPVGGGPAREPRSRSSPTSAGACRSPTSSATSDSSCGRCSSTSAASGRAREPNYQLQVLGSAFYRNKAAYVVGKIVNGNDETPVRRARAPRRDGRLVLDTILLEPEAISVLFSLSRAYFMVDMDVPSGYVAVPADADAGEAALGALHGGRAREAGEDALLPRPPPPPAPLAGRLRRGARHAAAS